jgi:hypothetical protein
MNAYYVVVFERDGQELVFLGVSYPPRGQKPIGYDPATYIEVIPDVYMMVGVEDSKTNIPFPCPTKANAERWAARIPGAHVEFVP